jgi:hypothetical protein
LKRLEPDLGFERMTLEAGVTNAMAVTQNTMATTGPDEAGRREDLAQLLDRLSQRLPVWRLAPGESHWPERSVVRVGPFDPVPEAPPRSALPAPVRLITRPVPLKVIAMVPDGPPLRLRLNGAVHDVARSDGPERIEPEWWHDSATRSGRDYCSVELASGARLWIGRAGALRPDRPRVLVPARLSGVSVAFTEVAAHTNFTLLDGASHPAVMVATAAMLGHAGIGVCDTDSLAGVVRAHSHSAVRKCCGGRLLGLKARE